jgi:hypothetical protein
MVAKPWLFFQLSCYTYPAMDSKEAERVGQLVDQFIDDLGESDNRVLKNLFHNAIKLVKDGRYDTTDLKIIDRSIYELRKTFQVFYPYRDARKVCIFGSARTPRDHPEFKLAEAFASQVTKAGFMVITGAGGGIMEAGNKGAEVGKHFGVNIDLPFEQSPNPYIAHDSKLVNYKYFFNRKLTFIRESDAVVLCPGGYGTHDEGFEILTLVQNGRSAPRPILLLCEQDNPYWDDWIKYVDGHLLNRGYVSDYDMHLFERVHSAQDAVARIQLFYSTYHSTRYFGNLAVLRLNGPLTPKDVVTLNEEFSHIITEGEIEYFEPNEFNIDDEYHDKHRIVFQFNMKQFGDLTRLIWRVNELKGENYA